VTYLSRYGKSYATKEEFEKRMQIFSEARVKILAMNARPNVTHRVGLNKFADWSKEEYRSLLKYRSMQTLAGVPKPQFRSLEFDPQPPQKIDWRDNNTVNEV
jgi:hypothetical protein